jgi:hypothetical protein
LVDYLFIREVILEKENSVVELKKSGRKPEVTLEQVVKASERLKQQNRKVTGWTIRDVIGSGGPNYLEGLWEQYQTDNGIKECSVESNCEEHILPAELEGKIHILLADLSEQINSFASESDQLAIRIADKKAKAAYETLMTTNKQLIEEQELANRMIEDSDDQLEDKNKLIETLEMKTSSQEKSIQSLKSNLEKNEDEHIRTKFILAEAQRKISELTEKCTALEKSEIKLNTKVEIAIGDKKDVIEQMEKSRTKLAELTASNESHAMILAEKDKRLIQLEEQLKGGKYERS